MQAQTRGTLCKTVFAAAAAALASYWGKLLLPLAVLLAVLVIDYITGMVKSYLSAQLSAQCGLKGIVKKLCYLFLVAASGIVDWLLLTGLGEVGVAFPFEGAVAMLVVVWLVINELISILENLSAIGVPAPPGLDALLRHLKRNEGDRLMQGGPKETEEA